MLDVVVFVVDLYLERQSVRDACDKATENIGVSLLAHSDGHS